MDKEQFEQLMAEMKKITKKLESIDNRLFLIELCIHGDNNTIAVRVIK